MSEANDTERLAEADQLRLRSKALIDSSVDSQTGEINRSALVCLDDVSELPGKKWQLIVLGRQTVTVDARDPHSSKLDHRRLTLTIDVKTLFRRPTSVAYRLVSWEPASEAAAGQDQSFVLVNEGISLRYDDGSIVNHTKFVFGPSDVDTDKPSDSPNDRAFIERLRELIPGELGM